MISPHVTWNRTLERTSDHGTSGPLDKPVTSPHAHSRYPFPSVKSHLAKTAHLPLFYWFFSRLFFIYLLCFSLFLSAPSDTIHVVAFTFRVTIRAAPLPTHRSPQLLLRGAKCSCGYSRLREVSVEEEEEEEEMELPDEYQKLVNRMMNTPRGFVVCIGRVVIDNAVCATATVVRVNSARKRGMLLEAVQVLTDLDLIIQKGYISSDGRWFMDVFHVVDDRGRKLLDPALLSRIERSLSGEASSSSSTADDGENNHDKSDGCGVAGLTALELTGTDRPGLLSEVFAVLRDLECNVVEAKVWTHNGRIASLIFVKDHHSGSPIADAHRVHRIEARLRNVLRGDHDVRGAKTTVASPMMTHSDRRLHQLMFADRDYGRVSSDETSLSSSSSSKLSVSVQNWTERGYSVVNVQCRDRPKLLFDVVCTLTDMGYVVFHGTVGTDADRAYQVKIHPQPSFCPMDLSPKCWLY
ncbi:hypothetical protein BHM03_00049789 [Ensete ventricosum]|nr:hypothetical protein BHM03_00049789 [Ensete ventricosum]